MVKVECVMFAGFILPVIGYSAVAYYERRYLEIQRSLACSVLGCERVKDELAVERRFAISLG